MRALRSVLLLAIGLAPILVALAVAYLGGWARGRALGRTEGVLLHRALVALGASHPARAVSVGPPVVAAFRARRPPTAEPARRPGLSAGARAVHARRMLGGPALPPLPQC